MKKIFFILFLFSLLLIPIYNLNAQSLSTTNTTTVTFDSDELPGWAKDLRRWNIISFGLFPFSMFAVTFTTDMIRWYDATGLDWGDRRYAPWPFKSAGAIEMTNDEYLRTALLAAGVSASVAVLDLIIINLKRNNERRRIESMPTGSVEIERRPYGDSDDEDAGEE